MTTKDIEEIKKTIKEFFEKIAFETEVVFLSFTDSNFIVNLKTEEPQLLIGEGGQTLSEIQHLLKAILKRKIEAFFYLDLDINDYKKKKIQYLKELANSIAEEVALTQKEKILSPMSAYQRRIIHLELSKRKDIATESIGKEPERRIIIRPLLPQPEI